LAAAQAARQTGGVHAMHDPTEGGLTGGLLELAAAGADVVVHARISQRAAENVAAAIRNAGRRSVVILADLAVAANHAALVDQAWQWADRVDIWVNNAGADVLTGEAAELPFEEKMRRLWQLDVLATIGLSRLAGQRMRSQAGDAGSCVILNMGWDQAEFGMAGDSGQMFGAIKGAISAFSKSLAQSLAPEVRVNCLAPGWIKTAWAQQASDGWQQRACEESLMARWGTPEDVAAVARFLASPAAAFISGQVIAVNGGFRWRQQRT